MERTMVIGSASMAISRDEIFRDSLQLERKDRATLAALLIDSLDPASDQDVEQAWMRESDRRAVELGAGSAETIPWETVRARLRALRR
jgi:putative addiction module component (TIGR02574 family)